MTAPGNNSPHLSEIYIAPHKVLRTCVVIYAGTLFALWFMMQQREESMDPLFTLTIPAGAVILAGWNELIALKRNPRLTLRADGLEIRNLGFWPNHAVKIEDAAGDRLHLALPLPGRPHPRAKRACGAHALKYDGKTRTLHVTFHFPHFAQNIDVGTFFKKSSPPSTVQRALRDFSSWKNLLFGNAAPTPGHCLTAVASLAAAGFLFYLIFTRNFIPSPEWKFYAWLSSLALTFGICLAILRKFLRDKKANAPAFHQRMAALKEQKIRPRYALALAPFAVFCMTYLITLLAIPSLHAAILGAPVEKTVRYEEKDFSSRSGYHLKSQELGTGLFKEFRITQPDYARLPDSGVITAVGKETFFGFRLESYRFTPTVEPKLSN